MIIYTRSGARKTGARMGSGAAAIKQMDDTRFTHWHVLGCQNAQIMTAVTGIANSVRAYPFISPPYPIKIDQLHIVVTTQSAGNFARIGIYANNNPDGSITLYPGRLLYQSSEFSTGGTAPFLFQTSTGLDIELEPGRVHWFSWWSNGTAACRSILVANSHHCLGTTALGTADVLGWGATLTYTPSSSQMPDPYPALATAQTNTPCATGFARFIAVSP